ncbi:MAG: hypothetical protein IPJ19_08040 [Planctomycetes bacterium]|nr:hypothetical protein [Planctomycetota bacterium]
MRLASLALSIASLALAAAAQDAPRSAADVTEEWRGLARVFDRVIPPEDATGADPRTLVLLVDPTASLAATGFADALAAALERHAASLGRVRIGVARVGADKPLCAPTDDASAILSAVRAALASPDERIQNVYASLRDSALAIAGRSGERALLLATLENGDAEDDLEATVARLAGTKTRVFVFAGESYLADSYWSSTYVKPEKPKETQLTGGDSAVIDVPWSWLFQLSSANEMTPSGFACYGLNRVAAGSGGRVWVYQPANAGAHTCMIWGSCLFCSGDHAPESELYNRALIAPLAPCVAPRGEVLNQLGDDPVYKAVLNAWRAALAAGLLRGTPPRAGHATSVDSNAASRGALLTSGPPERNAERAEGTLKDCERIQAVLASELARADNAKSSPRSIAIAEYTRVMLEVTKTNLVGYIGWCQEIAPRWLDKNAPAPLAPEIPALSGDLRNVTIGWTNRSLCHGALPFLEVELPGSERFAKQLAALDARIKAFEQRYTHTPYATALHRQGLATFQQTGTATSLEKKRPKSRNGPELGPQSGGNTRPPRAGGGSTGGSGPATGGGGG